MAVYKIGYARVSTEDQSTGMQTDALQKCGCQEIFTETASGARRDRPELAKALDRLRAGDVLCVWKLDRLARDLRHLLNVVEGLAERGVGFVSLTEGFDTTTPAGKAFFHICGAMAEMERNLIRERVVAGLQQARRSGKALGRPKTDEAKIEHARSLIVAGWSVRKAAETAGISRTTLYRAGDVPKSSFRFKGTNGSFGNSKGTNGSAKTGNLAAMLADGSA